jgi:hypothetical protein
MYSNGTGFLDLPPIVELGRMILTGTLPSSSVISILYPLLLGVGAIMSGFFGYHVKYVLKARTTLEHRVLLEQSVLSLFHSGSAEPMSVNPFHQGWHKNLLQILGPNLFLVFLPVRVRIPAPYLSKLQEKDKLQ